MQSSEMHFLKRCLPLTMYTLFVMSSTQKHGMSLLTLYHRSAMQPGPCLLVLFSPLKLCVLSAQSLICSPCLNWSFPWTGYYFCLAFCGFMAMPNKVYDYSLCAVPLYPIAGLLCQCKKIKPHDWATSKFFSRLLDCSWQKTWETCCKSSLIWTGYISI